MVVAVSGPSQVPVIPGSSSTGKEGAGRLTGAGSSFVYPLMSKWASVYNRKTAVQVNYQSIGSGGGIKQFNAETVDFGATDGPMTDDELKESGGPVLHIPVTMGAVVVTCNLPGFSKPLNLSGPTIAKLFMGDIRKWNDPAVSADNPGVALPDASVVVVHRSDGSGTTFIFSDFLSRVSPEWKQRVGTAKSLSWPAGIGAKGNEGVAAQVSRTKGAIGYVEQLFAQQTKMPVAAVKNHAGVFVAPSPEAVTAAAGNSTGIPDDLRMSITDSPGEAAYPIAGMVWVLARPKMRDPARASTLREFLGWVLGEDAQALAGSMNYSKLPPDLLEKARAKAAQVR
jgi:phosphate transport system substrate-binding protein